MKFDPTKPCQTRDGRAVDFLGRRNHLRHPLVFSLKSSGGLFTATEEGCVSFNAHCDSDIINTPEKCTVWVNIYSDSSANIHETKELADKFSVIGRIACVQVAFTEGDGL